MGIHNRKAAAIYLSPTLYIVDWYILHFFQLLTFGRKFPLVILANMDSTSGISAFIDRQISLLQQERDTEVEESNLLLSNCAPKLLEKKGLALLNLSVANVQVGLGGRR